MKTIRFGTFETNSSSEHSVSLFNADEIKDFKEGREYYDTYSGFISVKDWKEDLKETKYSITDEQLNQMFKWFISFIEEERDLKGWYFDSDEYDEKFDKSFTKDMIAFLKERMSNSGLLWVWDNWGYGYDESSIEDITTPHGDVVYALTYSGYCD